MAGATRARERIFIGFGIAMTIAFVWAASNPLPGKVLAAFSWSALWLYAAHYAAHFAAFATYAVVWSLGLPRVRPVVLACAVIAFGFLHEAYEIQGHSHGFELDDAIVDALGAIAGLAARELRRS